MRMATQCGWAGHHGGSARARFLITLARPCGHDTMSIYVCDDHAFPVGTMARPTPCDQCGVKSGIRVIDVVRKYHAHV